MQDTCHAGWRAQQKTADVRQARGFQETTPTPRTNSSGPGIKRPAGKNRDVFFTCRFFEDLPKRRNHVLHSHQTHTCLNAVLFVFLAFAACPSPVSVIPLSFTSFSLPAPLPRLFRSRRLSLFVTLCQSCASRVFSLFFCPCVVSCCVFQ